MTKDEKIKFVLDTFEKAMLPYANGYLILPKENEVWLHRYIKSAGFSGQLQYDTTLEECYKTAVIISRM